MRKKILAAMLVVAILAVSTFAYAATIYWSRTIQHSVTILGIEAELLKPTYDDYRLKNVATQLTDSKVVLTIYAENFYEIWLNITWTSGAEGLAVTASGEYVDVFWHAGDQRGHVDPIGDPFDVTGYHVIDKTKMMYAYPEGATWGHGLLVTFTFDTEQVTIPGDYTVDLLFEMGFA